jgi:putative membrane protein
MNNINKDLILRERLALQRTTLANQSTFLSFLRTSMYFLVAGLSMKSVLKIDSALTIQVIFFLISFVILSAGTVNYFRQQRKIKESERHIGDYKTEYLE